MTGFWKTGGFIMSGSLAKKASERVFSAYKEGLDTFCTEKKTNWLFNRDNQILIMVLLSFQSRHNWVVQSPTYPKQPEALVSMLTAKGSPFTPHLQLSIHTRHPEQFWKSIERKRVRV